MNHPPPPPPPLKPNWDTIYPTPHYIVDFMVSANAALPNNFRVAAWSTRQSVSIFHIDTYLGCVTYETIQDDTNFSRKLVRDAVRRYMFPDFPATEAKPVEACNGEHCGRAVGTGHSAECAFGHYASYSGLHTETPEVLAKLKHAYTEGYAAGDAMLRGAIRKDLQGLVAKHAAGSTDASM